MALSANTVWEVRTTGSSTNGGGYVSGGTDWSQQDAAQYSVTDGVTAGTTTITSATANFGTDVVGNLIYVSGGTGSVAAARYQIISRTNATTIVVDRSTGLTAGTGVTLKIGGAVDHPNIVIPIMVSYNIVWIKTGTYDFSTGVTVATATYPYKIEGYNSTRGDGTAASVTLRATAAITMITGSNGGTAQSDMHVYRNLTLDGNSDTGTNATTIGSTGTGTLTAFINVIIKNWSGNGINGGSSTYPNVYGHNLEIYGCNKGISGASACTLNVMLYGCSIHDNTSHGVEQISGQGLTVVGCLFYDNGGSGLVYTGRLSLIQNCTAYNNTSHGFHNSASGWNLSWIRNCVSYGNGAKGFSKTGSTNEWMFNCAAAGNTTGQIDHSTAYQINCITTDLTGNPFTNAPSGDFSLNNTAGQGAILRAAGFPGVFPDGTTTGYLDIGAAQHQDSGGGSSVKGMRILGG